MKKEKKSSKGLWNCAQYKKPNYFDFPSFFFRSVYLNIKNVGISQFGPKLGKFKKNRLYISLSINNPSKNLRRWVINNKRRCQKGRGLLNLEGKIAKIGPNWQIQQKSTNMENWRHALLWNWARFSISRKGLPKTTRKTPSTRWTSTTSKSGIGSK